MNHAAILGREIKEEFLESKIIMPGEMPGDRAVIWTPPNYKEGAPIAIHAPLNDAVQQVLLEKKQRDYWLRKGQVGPPPIMGAAAGAWTFTNNTRTYILTGPFDWDTDTFKIALLLSTSNIGAASTTHAGVTNEHANANGYTTGGEATTIGVSGTTTVTVDASDVVWTASGGSIVARFGELYEVSGNVAAYFLLESTGPADVTATTGNTLTIVINASGVFTLA